MHILDSVTLADTRLSDSGYLEANARTARTGIQQYLGSEVGRPDIRIVNVYRDEKEVFAKRSLETFSKLPVTNDHPAEPVTAANWKQHVVGTTGDDVLRDGEYLKIGLKVADAGAVRDIQSGKRELSVGYECELVWEDGIAPDGTPYQARQTNIVGNHIAIVSRGRAGSRACIGDAWPTEAPTTKEEKPMTLKTVTVDGIPVEVTDQGAVVIATLQQRLGDSHKALADAKTDHEKALAAKDADLAKKDAELDDLKSKQLSDADLDKRVQSRADLIATAKAIHDADYTGKADADIRKAVVVAKLGDAALAGKSEAYIDARFDILADEAKQRDPFRDHMRQQDGKPNNPADNGQGAYEQRLTDAWKGETK